MRIAGRCIRTLVVFTAILLAGAGGRPAVAAQYSAIVMDMRDGTVLYESNPDRRQQPASLTKMMTLYLAFEAVQNGQVGLDQRGRISRHAARQPASKLYLRAGQRVSIRSLIRASATKPSIEILPNSACFSTNSVSDLQAVSSLAAAMLSS